MYREQKAILLSEKKSLEEKIARIEHKQNDWLEPMAEWIKVASNLEKTARDNNLFAKKVATKEIFGLNLVLANREAAIRTPSGSDSVPQIQWAAATAAHEMASKKSKSFVSEPERGIEPPTYGLQNRCPDFAQIFNLIAKSRILEKYFAF